MRFVRSALIGVVALAFGAVVSPLPATAAVPSPPYTAFVVDGGAGSPLLTGILAFDATNSSISIAATAGNGFLVLLRDSQHPWSFSFAPPLGSTITVGTTYPTLNAGADATHGRMAISGEGRTCNHQSGFMTVKELTLAPGTTRPTVLAATYSLSCETDEQVLFGEIRYNSSMPVAAATLNSGHGNFGEQPVGMPGSERAVTITAVGSSGSVLGAASIVGGTTFAITSDTCSNATLAPGGTCTIGVRAGATALGEQTAWLRLVPANNPSGVFYAELRLTGFDPKRLEVAPPAGVDFGTRIVGWPTLRDATLTATGAAPVSLGNVTIGGTNAAAFTLDEDSCSGATIQVGQLCQVLVRARPLVRGISVASLIIPTDNMTGPVIINLQVVGEADNTGAYYPLAPSRILDTRVGNGASGPVGPGGTIHLPVAGRGGVPTSGVSAVVLNVTVAGPTTSGHITVWPTGVARPEASSLNFAAGWTGANSVTTALGGNGQIDLFNSAGNTHLIADVVGYYTPDNSLVPIQGLGGEFQPRQPQRLFDSRVDGGKKLPGGQWIELAVSYDQTYDPHIRALAVNVTAVDGSGDGYLTTFSGQGTPPLASTLNFTRTGAVPNFAIVPAGRCLDCEEWPIPRIGIYVSVDVHVIVDIVGFYDDGELADTVHDGLRFEPRTPWRIADSRTGWGLSGPLGSAATASLTVHPVFPATEAAALNLTAVAPTSTTFVSVWPTGSDRPTVSTLNPNAGQVVANAAPVLLGDGNMFNVYNNVGSLHLVIDMVGSFYYLPATKPLGLTKIGVTDAGASRATRLRAQLHQ